jgi:inosine/xanthosine triphosphate pyrophosphatase family protein/dephospho-CoA kinase
LKNKKFYLNIFFVSSNVAKIYHFLDIFDRYQVPLRTYKSRIKEYDESHDISADDAMLYSIKAVKTDLGHLGMFFIEDSTITINALSTNAKKVPGLATKSFFENYDFDDINRMIKEHGNDRTATISSKISLNIPGSVEPEIFSAELNGKFLENKCQTAAEDVPIWINNTPFAPYFIPDGKDKPFLQLSKIELNEIDIRFKATEQLIFRLKQFSSIYENRLLTIRNKPAEIESHQNKLFNPPLIIISGYSSSGKTTVSSYLKNKYNLDHIEESSIVTSEISLVPHSDRKTSIDKIVEQFGPLHFIKKATEDIPRNRHKPICISGVRTLVEVDYLKRQFPFSILLYIDGHTELFDIRHQIKCRQNKDIESDYQRLIANEIQWGMESIKANADHIIANNCNFELLFYQVDEFYNSIIR